MLEVSGACRRPSHFRTLALVSCRCRGPSDFSLLAQREVTKRNGLAQLDGNTSRPGHALPASALLKEELLRLHRERLLTEASRARLATHRRAVEFEGNWSSA